MNPTFIVKPDIPTTLTLYNRGIGNWPKHKEDCTKNRNLNYYMGWPGKFQLGNIYSRGLSNTIVVKLSLPVH